MDPALRADHRAGCAAVVAQARAGRGCLGFAIRPDPIDPARINGDGCLQALYFRMGSPVPVPISCGRLVVM